MAGGGRCDLSVACHRPSYSPGVTEFGDWEPEDSFAPGNEPDPAVVALRLHELRVWLAQMNGEGYLPRWEDLNDGERTVGVALAEELTRHLLTAGRDGSALTLHEARRFLGDQPVWEDLDPDERRLALALGDDIVRWLQTEGTEIR